MELPFLIKRIWYNTLFVEACKNIHAISGEIKTKYHRHEVSPDILSTYKTLIDNPSVNKFYNVFATEIAAGQLSPPWYIGASFARAAMVVSKTEVVSFATIAVGNKVSRISIFRLEAGDALWVINSLTSLAENCPLSQKLKLLSVFEKHSFLQTLLKDASVESAAKFFSTLLVGIDEDTVLSALRYSPAWESIRKNTALRDALIDQDQRLLPAMGT